MNLTSLIDRPAHWNPASRHYDFKTYLRNVFDARVAKLPIDAGFTCPNRDGRSGTGGWVFCDGLGYSLRQAGPLPSVSAHVSQPMRAAAGAASQPAWPAPTI